jgi:SAM-dependent methyltransferase
MTAVLDLGCGNRKREGATGIDVNPASQADVIHDLNTFPYPFPDSSFDLIIADNIIEHLDDVIRVMEELSRIAKPGAELIITVPYFRSRWASIDPTHQHFFTSESFSYFDVDHVHYALYGYSKIRTGVRRVVFNEDVRHTGLKRLVCGIFLHIGNRSPAWYDAHLGHLYPLDTITYHIEMLK